MTTTEEILKKASELGKMVSGHDASIRFQEVVGKLQNDIEAQRILNDFNRAVQKIAEQEAAGKPIEVDDKRHVEKLHMQVIRYPLLRDFQIAQMDYLDLMRRVDEAIGGTSGEEMRIDSGDAALKPISPRM